VMVFSLSRINLQEDGEDGSLKMGVVMEGSVSSIVRWDRIAVAIVVTVR